MSPTTSTYIVAYAHPHIRAVERIRAITVKPGARGEDLLDQLRNKYSDYRDDLKYATLWKASGFNTADVVDSKENTYNWISERGKHPETEIRMYHTLEMHLPNHPPSPPGDTVDIMVVTKEIEEYIGYRGDPHGYLWHMKNRMNLSADMKAADLPSDAVASAAGVKGAVDRPSGPRYGRPSDHYGPPTALFSRDLARLEYNLKYPVVVAPDPGTVEFAFQLITTTTRFFDNETSRENPVRVILEAALGSKGQWQTSLSDKTTRPNGVWLESFFIYLVVEMKNEPGLGGDPFLQGLIVYSKIIAQEEYAPYLKSSNMPIVLLAIAGNVLTVSAAVFTDAVYANKLVSIDLEFGHQGSENVLRVARAFTAIRECVGGLRKLYRNLKSSSRIPQPNRVMWPNPTPNPPDSAEGIQKLGFFAKVDCLKGTPITRAPIDEDNRRHAIYLAKMRSEDGASTTDVLVKFTTTYNEAAHRLLANHDPPLAPTLYSCKPVIGNMYMVVMQYIPESEGGSLRKRSMKRSILDTIRRDVTRALELLHEQEFVFGDLQELNVLYLASEDRAMLVGFDDVGREGKDRYSCCLGPEAGLGVGKWQIMEKIHDSKNFERLMEQLYEQLGLQ